MSQSSRRAFVTVGSTKFTELIKAVLSDDTIAVLEYLGFTELSLQYGTDKQLFLDRIQGLSTKLSINGFDYSPSVENEMQRSLLIISHAGSGSVLEALHFGKLLVVVPNTSLMDNHQQEVADALSADGYLLKSSSRTLASDLAEWKRYRRLEDIKLKPFPLHGSIKFAKLLDKELGLD